MKLNSAGRLVIQGSYDPGRHQRSFFFSAHQFLPTLHVQSLIDLKMFAQIIEYHSFNYLFFFRAWRAFNFLKIEKRSQTLTRN